MPVPALADLEALYPDIPTAALEAYLEHYGESGGEAAWALVRLDPRYEEWFPGNLTDLGEPRYAEDEYESVKEAYRDVYRSVGIDPKWLDGHFGALIRGEKSPDELAAQVHLAYDRIVSASDNVKAKYRELTGTEGLTDEALLLAYLDPTIQTAILEGEISVAEVSGTALDFGFDIDFDAVRDLVAADLTKGGAQQLFAQARRIVPIMDRLASRHEDQDDDFDIDSFLASEFWSDPAENYRMRRLMAAERAQFGKALTTRQGQMGSLTGLVAD